MFFLVSQLLIAGKVAIVADKITVANIGACRRFKPLILGNIASIVEKTLYSIININIDIDI
jgi:hypothetical protein